MPLCGAGAEAAPKVFAPMLVALRVVDAGAQTRGAKRVHRGCERRASGRRRDGAQEARDRREAGELPEQPNRLVQSAGHSREHGSFRISPHLLPTTTAAGGGAPSTRRPGSGPHRLRAGVSASDLSFHPTARHRDSRRPTGRRRQDPPALPDCCMFVWARGCDSVFDPALGDSSFDRSVHHFGRGSALAFRSRPPLGPTGPGREFPAGRDRATMRGTKVPAWFTASIIAATDFRTAARFLRMWVARVRATARRILRVLAELRRAVPDRGDHGRRLLLRVERAVPRRVLLEERGAPDRGALRSKLQLRRLGVHPTVRKRLDDSRNVQRQARGRRQDFSRGTGALPRRSRDGFAPARSHPASAGRHGRGERKKGTDLFSLFSPPVEADPGTAGRTAQGQTGSPRSCGRHAFGPGGRWVPSLLLP